MSPLASWLLLGGLFWLGAAMVAVGFVGFGARWVDDEDYTTPLVHGTTTTDDGWTFTPTGGCTCRDCLVALALVTGIPDLAEANERRRLHRVHLADQIEASMARHPSRPGHVTTGVDFTAGEEW